MQACYVVSVFFKKPILLLALLPDHSSSLKKGGLQSWLAGKDKSKREKHGLEKS